MKTPWTAALRALALPAAADHYDVIEVMLNEGCKLSQYVAIAKDFDDTWGKSRGYDVYTAR